MSKQRIFIEFEDQISCKNRQRQASSVKKYAILEQIEGMVALDLKHQDKFKNIVTILENYIEVVKSQPKMKKYLEKVSLTPQQLIQSFQRIIGTFIEVYTRSRKNKNVYFTMNAVWEHMETFLKSKNLQELDTQGKTVWIIEVETKVSCSATLMHDTKILEDITNSPKELFHSVWQKITIIPPKDLKKLISDLKDLKKMLHMTVSAVINQQSHDLSLTKVVSYGLSFPKYFFLKDSGKLKSFQFYRTPTIQIAQKFWNLPEEGATREFIKVIYQGITTNKKIYLPQAGEINNKTDIFTQNPSAIQVRILYSEKLHIFAQGKSGLCCLSQTNESQFIDTVLIHMHGGGFIALSSRSAQGYTRRWANQLNVPIFSIDYRMPPNHPFPSAPQDCFAVYSFLINHVHKFMNIKPTNIYITGDSAGGNLACSLTGLILRNKLPVPRGLYVAYPAVDLRLHFTFSRIYALTDVLLWPSILLLCLNSYLNKDFTQSNNPIASPLLLTEQFVNGTVGDKRFPLNWPKTMIAVGSKDPLLDDSLMLMQRMDESKIQCECIIYEGLSHGFLSTDRLIQQTEKTIRDSIEQLKILMGIESYKK